MNLVDLMTNYMIGDYTKDHVWDEWFEYRIHKAGIDYKEHNSAWRDMLDTMPHHFSWYPNVRKGLMELRWEGGKEDIPLKWFYEEEDEPDLEMVWHAGYYDGPLSGMAKYNGEYVWFDMTTEDHYGNRMYGLYSLCPEDKAELFRRHREFQECVGYHCDHHPDVHKPFTNDNPEKFDWYYHKKEKNAKLILNQEDKLLRQVHWFHFKYYGRPR